MQEISSISITSRFECRTLHIFNVGERKRRNCKRRYWWSLLGNFWVKSGILDYRWLRRVMSSEQEVASGWLWVAELVGKEMSLVWRLTKVWSGVILKRCWVTEAPGRTGSPEHLSGRYSVTWTRVNILIRVNFWPLHFTMSASNDLTLIIPLQRIYCTLIYELNCNVLGGFLI